MRDVPDGSHPVSAQGGQPTRIPGGVPAEVALALYPDATDPRLMPQAGRRDRLFMMLLEDPAGPRTVAEEGWMEDHDPQGLRDAIVRADQFHGGPGSFIRYQAPLLADLWNGPGRAAFERAIVVERLLLGMDSPGYSGAMDLDLVNEYLRRR